MSIGVTNKVSTSDLADGQDHAWHSCHTSKSARAGNDEESDVCVRR